MSTVNYKLNTDLPIYSGFRPSIGFTSSASPEVGLSEMLGRTMGNAYTSPETMNFKGLGIEFDPSVDIGQGPMADDSSWLGDLWGDTKGILGDKDFMSGLSQVGSFGLGLADYFMKKDPYDTQNKIMEQNLKFAKQDQDNKNLMRQQLANL